MDPAVAKGLEETLAKLRNKPCLITFGDKDEMYKEHWHERWTAEYPDYELVTLPGVMHFPFEDAPDATLAAFQAWQDNASGARVAMRAPCTK